MERLFSLGMLGARILLSSVFLLAGVEKIAAFSATQTYMAQHGMKMTAMFLVLAILFEVGGGICLLLGYFPRLGAAALFLYLIPVTAVFHRDLGNPAQLTQFAKNVAIMGGLLAVVTAGGGGFALWRGRA